MVALPRFRLAVALLMLLFAGLFVLGNAPARLQRLSSILLDRKKPNTDFFQNWAAATDWHQGKSIYAELHTRFASDFAPYLGDVYRPEEQPRHWGLSGPHAGNVLQINAHPPFATLLTLWSGLLLYSQAHTAWVWMNLGMLLVSAGLIVGGTQQFVSPRLRTGLFLALSLFLLASEPIRAQFVEGNWNIVLLLLLASAWRLEQQRHLKSAGVLIGIAALVKLYPGLLLFAFVLRKQYSAAIAFFATLVFGGLLTLAIFGWQAHWDYATVVIPRIKMQQYLQNLSLVATTGRLFDPVKPNVIPLIQSAPLVKLSAAMVGLLLVIPILRHRWQRKPFHADGLFMAVLLLSLIFSPVLWPHGLLQCCFPVWVLLMHALARRSAAMLMLTLLPALVMWPNPTEIWAWCHPADTPYQPWETVTILAAPLIGVIMLYFSALYLALQGEPTK